MNERNAFPVLTPQTFRPLNGGNLFFPKGHEEAALGLAALATPFSYGPQHVHAVPIFYGRPKASLPASPIGFSSPGV